MIANHKTSWKDRKSRGVSLMIVAVGMIFILGMAGLAIDLASLYVGRSQAQRAADAAALAGAQALVVNDCVPDSTGTISGACISIAQTQAADVGNSNLIAGDSPSIKSTDVTVDTSVPNDPQVTVYAGRGTYNGSNHNNPLPTFFMKIFGVDTASVSAKATAEAFNPSGSGMPIGVQCVKPWFFANCDPNYTSTSSPNPDCSPSTGPFVTVVSGKATVARSGSYQSGTGVIGEPFTMKPGSPGSAAAPGQYYAAFIPTTTTVPTYCPSCAKTGGGSGKGTGSAAVYRANIECCNTNAVVCGVNDVTIQSSAGNMVGPTNQGVQCLIQQGNNCGQDYLDGISSPCTAPSSPPKANQIPNYASTNPHFTIIPGANNNTWAGQTSVPMTSSNSVVAVPIYKGVLHSGQNSVEVIGFLKVFLQYVDKKDQGTVYGYIMDVTACGSGGSGSGGTGPTNVISGAAGQTIPVRLIRSGS
jgi:Flp pilus assembly protein TadG